MSHCVETALKFVRHTPLTLLEKHGVDVPYVLINRFLGRRAPFHRISSYKVLRETSNDARYHSSEYYTRQHQNPDTMWKETIKCVEN